MVAMRQTSFAPCCATPQTIGFLSTDDLAAPGNLGLYDQIAALRWIKRNIQSFGGNNDDITIMGHNAGAISASLLLLAPHETQGKFCLGSNLNSNSKVARKEKKQFKCIHQSNITNYQ